MMKCRQKLLAAGLILCIAVTGCAGQDKAGDAVTPSSGAVSQTEGQENSAAESGEQIPNPMEEVKDILAFEDFHTSGCVASKEDCHTYMEAYRTCLCHSYRS